MRKPMIGAAVAALALGGTGVAFGEGNSKKIDEGAGEVAFAAGPPGLPGERAVAIAVDGGPGFAFHEDGHEDFAADLAEELGLETSEVERALEAVAEKHESERRTEMATAIAEHLDGVSVEQVEAALATAEEALRQSFEDGEAPEPGEFAQTIADELGVSEQEVEDALAAEREDAFAEHREELEGRLDAAVESGGLSEEEADTIRERLGQAPPPMLEAAAERNFPGAPPIAPPPMGEPGL